MGALENNSTVSHQRLTIASPSSTLPSKSSGIPAMLDSFLDECRNIGKEIGNTILGDELKDKDLVFVAALIISNPIGVGLAVIATLITLIVSKIYDHLFPKPPPPQELQNVLTFNSTSRGPNNSLVHMQTTQEMKAHVGLPIEQKDHKETKSSSAEVEVSPNQKGIITTSEKPVFKDGEFAYCKCFTSLTIDNKIVATITYTKQASLGALQIPHPDLQGKEIYFVETGNVLTDANRVLFDQLCSHVVDEKGGVLIVSENTRNFTSEMSDICESEKTLERYDVAVSTDGPNIYHILTSAKSGKGSVGFLKPNLTINSLLVAMPQSIVGLKYLKGHFKKYPEDREQIQGKSFINLKKKMNSEPLAERYEQEFNEVFNIQSAK